MPEGGRRDHLSIALQQGVAFAFQSGCNFDDERILTLIYRIGQILTEGWYDLNAKTSAVYKDFHTLCYVCDFENRAAAFRDLNACFIAGIAGEFGLFFRNVIREADADCIAKVGFIASSKYHRNAFKRFKGQIDFRTASAGNRICSHADIEPWIVQITISFGGKCECSVECVGTLINKEINGRVTVDLKDSNAVISWINLRHRKSQRGNHICEFGELDNGDTCQHIRQGTAVFSHLHRTLVHEEYRQAVVDKLT